MLIISKNSIIFGYMESYLLIIKFYIYSLYVKKLQMICIYIYLSLTII